MRSSITCKRCEAYRLHEDLTETLDQELEMLCAVEATQSLSNLICRRNLLGIRPYDSGNGVRDEYQQKLKRVCDEDLFRISLATAQINRKSRPSVRIVLQDLSRSHPVSTVRLGTERQQTMAFCVRPARANKPGHTVLSREHSSGSTISLSTFVVMYVKGSISVSDTKPELR